MRGASIKTKVEPKLFFKPYTLSVINASIQVLLLGILTSLLFALVGPAFYMIMTPDQQTHIDLVKLFGHNLAMIIQFFGQPPAVEKAHFLGVLPYLILILATVRLLMSISQWYIWEKMSELVARDMRAFMIDRYLKLNPVMEASKKDFIDQNISSVITADIRFYKEYIIHFWGGFPREAVVSLSSIVVLVLLSPKLFAIFMLVILPTVYFLSTLGKKIKRRKSSALGDYATLSEWIQQRLLGIETIKHLGTEKIEIQNMRAFNDTLYQKFVRAGRVKSQTAPMLEMMASIGFAVVLFLAIRDASSGGTSGSVQLSFFANLGLLLQSLSKLARYYNSNREGKVSKSRIFSLIDAMEVTPVDENRLILTGQTSDVRLKIRGLTVKYPEAQSYTLQGFNYDFKAGKLYSVLGKSGVGKTTLFRAILGLVKIEKGTLELNASHSERAAVGYIPQNPPLIPGTLMENMAFPELSFDGERFAKAVEGYPLDDILESCPKGMREVVGPGGKDFSGGQTQKIHFARILYHGYPLVLIDEGTSGLDPESERMIYGLLDRLKQSGATILMITHRVATVEKADEVLILQAGGKVTTRSRAELKIDREILSLLQD